MPSLIKSLVRSITTSLICEFSIIHSISFSSLIARVSSTYFDPRTTFSPSHFSIKGIKKRAVQSLSTPSVSLESITLAKSEVESSVSLNQISSQSFCSTVNNVFKNNTFLPSSFKYSANNLSPGPTSTPVK